MITIEAGRNVFAQYGDAVEQKLDAVVRKTAFDVEAAAKAKAPVDVGALRASIYTVTSRVSGYGTAAGKVEAALTRHEKKRVKSDVSDTSKGLSFVSDRPMLPEAKRQTRLEALIAVGMAYGWWVEHGTAGHAAQPFLTPAMEAAKRPFEQAITAVLRGAK